MTVTKKIAAVLAMILFAALILSACTAQPFRLHIIANSNSEQDQQIKLSIRDAVLSATKSGIQDCKNVEQAREYIKENMQTILTAANIVLEENGVEYTATATIGSYHFPEKIYQNVMYSEGDYQALRIILGQGQGENWWCVMFPPLCISEISALNEGEQSEQTQYKSFFAELFASWWDKNTTD